MLRESPSAGTEGRILVVDDAELVCASIKRLLDAHGYDTATTTSPLRALRLIAERSPDVVLTDLRMPGLDGLELMERARQLWPPPVFLVMTGYGSIPAAVEAVKHGAEDFLEKPFRSCDLLCKVEAAVDRAGLLARSRTAQGGAETEGAFASIVGDHPTMRAVLDRAKLVAPTRSTVLITGESGTGKGLMAEAIHRLSPRRDRPFVHLSCAALAESVLESELFGHERGAFTGAADRREGRFKQAEEGTLYLDEISEIPPATQVKLLRFLQDRSFERVGGNETLQVDVRTVAAANKDFEAEVTAGRFREDLFYRLNVVRIHMPPLRERLSDIPALAARFFDRFVVEHEKPIDGLSAETLERLMAYDWPGNVRELEHAVEHLVIMSREGVPQSAWLPESLTSRATGDLGPKLPGSTLREIERAAILESLAAVDGDTGKAAAMLGISRRKVQYRLREYQEVGRSSGKQRVCPSLPVVAPCGHRAGRHAATESHAVVDEGSPVVGPRPVGPAARR